MGERCTRASRAQHLVKPEGTVAAAICSFEGAGHACLRCPWRPCLATPLGAREWRADPGQARIHFGRRRLRQARYSHVRSNECSADLALLTGLAAAVATYQLVMQPMPDCASSCGRDLHRVLVSDRDRNCPAAMRDEPPRWCRRRRPPLAGRLKGKRIERWGVCAR
jgi:hypothetical protein